VSAAADGGVAEHTPVDGAGPTDSDPVGPQHVRELVAAMILHPSGQSSASVYETARLVSLAPWLPHHEERISWLLSLQRSDGGWGGPGGYALVPTLSAVEALLVALHRAEGGPGAGDRLRAVHDGLRFLHDFLGTPAAAVLPDLPATDLIVPALVELIVGHLDSRRDGPPTGLEAWRDAPPLPLPAGMDRGRLDRVRALLAAGRPVPEKLAHALEVGGAWARRAAGVAPVGPGTVGASPAATAAWLGRPDDRTGPALAYLEDVSRQHGGPVPCASPISVFERSWVLGTLARAGVPMTVPSVLVSDLRNGLGPAGTPTGPGLPADADTTSVTLYALARLGHPVDPSSLWSYDTGEHFCTWQGEDGASVTTNAHVLDALGHHLAHAGPTDASRTRSAVDRIAAWLIDRQEPDGRWYDRWHASPYYATYCTTLALSDHGRGPAARAAVARATDWVLTTQRADGSWGRWAGTAEETAYALQVLLAVHRSPDADIARAVVDGLRRLSALDGRDGEPALWHDKDLYRPTLIVRAAVLAAGWPVSPPTGTRPTRAPMSTVA
jgi:halimadienyl-diphosphate synthase